MACVKAAIESEEADAEEIAGVRMTLSTLGAFDAVKGAEESSHARFIPITVLR